ncbi:ankyrin repeat domain-containing protein, partial [bacterium]
DGTTGLMLAAIHGYNRTAEILLNAGANIDAQDHQGQTSLILAAQFLSEGVLSLLIEKRANLHLITKSGESALDIAKAGNFSAAIELLKAAGAVA